MTLRFLANSSFAVGLALLVSKWNARSGLAVGVAGLIIAFLVARYGIGPKRFLGLMLIAAFGKAFKPIINMAIDATEDQRVDESQDWIVNSIKRAWLLDPPQISISIMIVLVALGIGISFAAYDYHYVLSGNMGVVLPLKGARDPLDTQAVILGISSATLISSVLLSIYSAALRRMLLTAACVGSSMGAIISISVGHWERLIFWLGVTFLFAAILGALLIMWAELEEKQTQD